MQPRSSRLLDAAIQLVGDSGIRALTHRAVDTAAGLPLGSTSNLFRNRAALLHAMVARMIDVELASWDQLAGSVEVSTVDSLAEALAAMVEMLTGPMRAMTVARFALFVEAARDPALQAEIGRAGVRGATIGETWLARIGSTMPQEHTGIVMAYLDGLVLHRLSFPASDSDLVGSLRGLLSALVS